MMRIGVGRGGGPLGLFPTMLLASGACAIAFGLPLVFGPRSIPSLGDDVLLAVPSLELGLPLAGETESESPPVEFQLEDPVAAAVALSELRLELLGTPDPDLSAYAVAGSEVAAADEALVAQLAERGVLPSGAEVEVISAEVLHADESSAQVVLEYRISAHQLVAAAGEVTEVAASEAQVSTLELALTADGWRVAATG